jgi:ferric-dicitrate binding protein FerR (iron transport regulator)
VYLDNSVNGILATQGEVAVKRNERGEIVYTGEADVVAYNTLSIPKGSKPLRLVLADGSLVWLNAASSITYPTAFKGKERRVSMTGEAYFEVTKISGLPFFVDQGQGSIQVLGTQFNVNADAEKGSAKVTLLEGAVKVSNALNTVQILPGQQAQMTANKLKVVDGIDTEEVMSWKNGQFFFTGTDIRDIMKQVEQYYDVEVVFRDEIPYQFVAKISRDVNVSTFLEKLELTNLIHFTIEEKKIIVMK